MKKIACLLVVVMLLACLPLTAFAAKAGDTVTIEFTAENPGLTGVKATINYDATALKLGEVKCGVAGALTDVNENSVAIITMNAFTDKVLFTATFEVLPEAEKGKTYEVTATVTEALDADLNEITLAVAGGTIEVAACEHVWGEWTVTKEATCVDAGEKTRTCSACGETETEVIEATGVHTYESWTYVDEEVHEATCTVCGNKAQEKHTWDSGVVTVKPTETEDGVREHTCHICGGKKQVVEEYVDDVPNTGDITPVLTAGTVVLVTMLSTVAVVVKRKAN